MAIAPSKRPNRLKTLFFRLSNARAMPVVWRLVGIITVIFALLLLLLRYVVLPQIENYRDDVERALSAAIKLPVTIGSIEGRMQGIRPRLELHNLAIKDANGNTALSFDNVIGIVAWSSLLHWSPQWSPQFYWLEVDAPVLDVRRDAAGHIFIAGLAVKAEPSGPDISAWVLRQHTVAIREARVTWTDELRQAPPLTLEHLNLQLERTVINHRFGLTAQPPAALAGKIDVRGKFTGNSLNDIAHWAGQLYSEVGYADLAGWHPWLDYPVELPRGRGALRSWLDFAALRPTAVTADVTLTDVQVRLAPTLAMLSLRDLKGRIAFSKTSNGFELSTRQASLATANGLKIAPTDLQMVLDGKGGEFNANVMDLHALAALAAHLPLPEDFRQQLAAYAPQGSLEQLRLRWQGQQWPFTQYNIKGRFNKLAFASIGKQPGFSGLSGTIDGNQDLGLLQLVGRNATVTLPVVFHQPLPFDMLDAQVRWKQSNRHTELELSQVKFRNADAEGTASGRYEMSDKTNSAGVIDLDAKLTRAEGAAVWRYMPLQAGADVGPFLQRGLTQGKVTEATLKLKGNLDNFPFSDRSGTFRIHGVFHDAMLRYADSWPPLENVAGAIDFDGPTMTISANDARILGVHVGPAKAVMPDLVTKDEQLLVEGKAVGPTASFLKFIEASPVGTQIDHFTEDMTASGNGQLDLKLTLPLRRLAESKVAGTYRFDSNRLVLDPDMSPLDDVRGKLEFDAENLSARGLSGVILGMPLKLDMKTQRDGSVLAEISGDASAVQLRKQFSSAALKSLAGSAHWSGTVRARKKSAEVRISSDLVGLSSSLPEPFNKSAKEPMLLLVERKSADPKVLGKKAKDKSVREITELSLGRALRAQLIYRDEAGHSNFERGLVTLGDITTRLPDRGLTVAISQSRINVDDWHALLADVGDKQDVQSAASPPAANSLMPNRIDLRATELQLRGHTFHDVKISALRPAAAWATDISSREVLAKLEWLDGDTPKLSGRIMRFSLPADKTANATETGKTGSNDPLKTLPNLDLTLDHLALNGRDYGELHITAENKGNDWTSNFTVKNEDGALEGQGRWRLATQPTAQPATQMSPTSAASDTQLDFKLRAKSIDRFLARIGYPNTVKRGNADLNGHLAWKGAPHDFDVATLNGQLTLDARDGQFNKLEPGVGRLLGILSLQSLPRRISLDFRDIFSEGFAFDTIKGQMTLTNGLMDTKNMELRGPAARVQMAGNVDLVKETQDLKVRVQPTLSDSVAAGVLFVAPAIGATAWAFNKFFGNPLDNVFAFDYAVTGNWSDPKVDKVGAQSGAGSAKNAGKNAGAEN